MADNVLSLVDVQQSLGLSGSSNALITSYLPKTGILTAQNPIVSQSGLFSSPFGNLSNTTYMFVGVAQIEFSTLVVPPSPTYIGGDIAVRIGTSAESVNYFTLPPQTTSFIVVPINAIWNTVDADGNNPIFNWTLTPNATYTCGLGGGATVYLSGVMIPINQQ